MSAGTSKLEEHQNAALRELAQMWAGAAGDELMRADFAAAFVQVFGIRTGELGFEVMRSLLEELQALAGPEGARFMCGATAGALVLAKARDDIEGPIVQRGGRPRASA